TNISITPPAGKSVTRFEYWCYYCGTPSYQPVSPANQFDPAYIGDPARSGLYGARVRAVYNDGTVSPDSYTSIYPAPNPSIGAIGNMCVGASPVTLSLFPGDDGDPGTFVDGAAGVNESSPQVWTFTPSSPGLQTITYHYKDISYGCTNNYTTSFTVYSNPSPSITNSFSPGGYCFNSAAFALTGSPSGGTFSGPGTFFNTFYPYYNTSVGNNTITYTYSDANGCYGTASTNVVVNNSPTISIRTQRGDTSLCVDASGIGTIKLEASRAGQCSGATWSAYDGSTYTTGGNAGSFGFASPSGGSYNEATTFTNSAYQASTGYARIEVMTTGQPIACPAGYYIGFPVYLIPPPTIQITGLTKDKYCSTDPNISLTATANYKYPYAFNLYNGSDASNNNIVITSVPGGDPALVGKVFVPSSATTGGHTIEYAYTDVNGCSNFKDTILTINKSPQANFFIDSGRCATKATYFNSSTSFIPPTTTLSYFWDFGDGTTLADTSHLSNPVYTYPFPGGYPLYLKVVSSQGCFDDTTLSGANLLTIQSIPVADYTSRFICFGDSTNFKDLSSNASGALKSRSWIFSDKSNVPF
ncbi:MAG TPA: PKD domain-containing protein, partial [Ferruginibacter sp.]|nr:PKD domain-containing protein [Ferruginibacter sp.]